MPKISQVFIPSARFQIKKEEDKEMKLITQVFLLDDGNLKLLTDEATIIDLTTPIKK